MPLLNRICWFLFILKKYYSHCFVILQIFIFFIFSFKIRSIRTKSNSIENDICEYIYRKHISKLQALNPIPPTTRRRSARQGVSEVLSLTGYGIVICCATKLGLCFCVDMLEGFSQFFFFCCAFPKEGTSKENSQDPIRIEASWPRPRPLCAIWHGFSKRPIGFRTQGHHFMDGLCGPQKNKTHAYCLQIARSSLSLGGMVC